MPDQFAPAAPDLLKTGVASYPTPGQAFALDPDGNLPSAVRQFLPGYEYASASNGSSVAISGTSPILIVSLPPVYMDGRTTIALEFFSYSMQVSGVANRSIVVNFFDGSTDFGGAAAVTCETATGVAGSPVFVVRRLTPSQGYHTYSIKGSLDGVTGSGTVQAFSNTPALLRAVRSI
jgi:hypothetical protein